jgi:hypothetical protein
MLLRRTIAEMTGQRDAGWLLVLVEDAKRLEQMAQESESGLPISLVGQITKNLSSPFCKNIPLNMSPKSAA